MIAETKLPMADEAIRLASMGYRVFPLRPGLKVPLPGSRGVHDATTDIDVIERWWLDNPHANVGLAMGNGIAALDLDPGGMQAYGFEGVAEFEMTLADHPRQSTPRGGYHWIVREPEGSHWRNSVGKIGSGLDIRTDGGYIVVAPSRVVDPSKGIDGAYQWISPLPDDAGDIPLAPQWLIDAIEEAATARPTPSPASHSGGVSPISPTPQIIERAKKYLKTVPPAMQGSGGHAALLWAATALVRGFLLPDNETYNLLVDEYNPRCSPPWEGRELDREFTHKIAEARSKPFGKPPGWLLNEEKVDQSGGVDLTQFLTTIEEPRAAEPSRTTAISLGDLVGAYPVLRPPIIHGLLREGETMNIIAAPKTGKSWLVNDLAISVATGMPWLGLYDTVQSDVLIIDNELHRETSAHRIPLVAKARGVGIDQIADHIYIDNIRGRLTDIGGITQCLVGFEPGRFKVIILDAFYRFMGKGEDENDNGTMRDVYNALDNIANLWKCAFVLIHHASKGNQSAKSVTDVGAGAGAQSRATDTHLVLRPHEEDGVSVLDAAVRSFRPIEPACLRWTFPVWDVDDSLDPDDLKNDRGKKKKAPARQTESEPEPWTIERFVETMFSEQPLHASDFRQRIAQELGLSRRQADDLLDIAVRQGLVDRVKLPGRGSPISFVLHQNRLGE